MRCAVRGCETGFCFVCGKGDLEDGDQHWKVGMPCPKWNQPSEENALHDDFREEDVGLDGLAEAFGAI